MSRFLILSRRAILQWANWRSRKAMCGIDPQMADLDRRLRQCRKSHKRGSAAIIKAKQDLVHADLARVFPDRVDRERVEESW
jgi:hypothetical protein